MDLYALEIYLLENPGTPWVSFDSDTPFATITKGDLIDPSSWGVNKGDHLTLYRVASVEHQLIPRDEVTQHRIRLNCYLIEKNDDVRWDSKKETRII